MIALSERIVGLIDRMFPAASRDSVRQLLENECADNLPGCESHDPYAMERIRVSVLKLSEGDAEKLIQAIELAQTDWRDLLMAAGFGQDTEAHKDWSPATGAAD